MASVEKWGYSLAVRIPQSLARQIDVAEGTVVELSVRDGEPIMRPRPEVRDQSAKANTAE